MATGLDDPPVRARAEVGGLRGLWRRFTRWLYRMMPTGLFARSLLIIIMPVVLLQAAVGFVFMERHWQTVTSRLSSAMVADIAAVIDMMEAYPQDEEFSAVTAVARDRLALNIAVLPHEPLPASGPRPFFSPLDRAISRELARQIGRPFWIDTVGRSTLVEIRILLDDHVLRVFARRSQAYVSNSLIFVSWMVATSVVLLTIAIVFLRNQIRPILRLAAAVDDFGKGRSVSNFPPRGAREVRQATRAFHRMRRRVERQIEQRTAMLAGVSHDLRTVLTRFRLQLAILDQTEEVRELIRDVDDMNKMLDGYLAFARGDIGEETALTDFAAVVDELAREGRVSGHTVETVIDGRMEGAVRPQAFKRALRNLVTNACRHADNVKITVRHFNGLLTVTVDDDGPGIPYDKRDEVFKPFYRLDEARNLDDSGTGLGLPIARDIARSHGGDIELDRSPMGGLQAIMSIPT